MCETQEQELVRETGEMVVAFSLTFLNTRAQTRGLLWGQILTQIVVTITAFLGTHTIPVYCPPGVLMLCHLN